jgi:signal transduction histidine kinase
MDYVVSEMTRQATLLIIDDEDNLREDLVQMLVLDGFTVFEAANGQAGIDLARTVQPDLIICDVTMAGIDGFGVLETLRQDAVLATTPFIFLTARVDRADLRRGMRTGADDYLTKPFTYVEVLEAIQTRLHYHRNIANQALTQLDEVKTRLAHVVAHELRTPLLSITTTQDLLSRELDYLSREQVEELLQLLREGSTRLLHVVEQMVLMTHLETGLMSREVIREKGLATSVWSALVSAVNLARQFAYRNETGNLDIQFAEQDATILGHTPTLVHVLAEVITNAFNFSPANSPIHLLGWLDEYRVYIQIQDKGPGLPPEKIGQVLRPYSQVNRDQCEQQGLGLGLYLTQQIVMAHGGILHLNNLPEGGACVTIELPRLLQ